MDHFANKCRLRYQTFVIYLKWRAHIKDYFHHWRIWRGSSMYDCSMAVLLKVAGSETDLFFKKNVFLYFCSFRKWMSFDRQLCIALDDSDWMVCYLDVIYSWTVVIITYFTGVLATAERPWKSLLLSVCMKKTRTDMIMIKFDTEVFYERLSISILIYIAHFLTTPLNEKINTFLRLSQ